MQLRWGRFVLALAAAMNVCGQNVPAGNGGASSGPQLIPRTKAEREERYAAQHRVLLNVQVSDAMGHAVAGLSQQDFALRIGHQPDKVTLFRAVQNGGTTAKAKAVLVIDTVNNSAREIAFMRKEVEKFVRSQNGRLPLPIALGLLTSTGLHVGQSTRNGQELVSQLALRTRNVHPTDCTEDWNNAALGIKTNIMGPGDDAARNKEITGDRISGCLNLKFQISVVALRDFAQKQRDVPGRVIVIWLGAGWPVLSGPRFVPDTHQIRENDFANLVDVSTMLRDAQVTLDAVSWPARLRIAQLDRADWEMLERGTPTAPQASARSLAMPVLAQQSGGRVYFNQKSLATDIAACLGDGDSFYVLGFDSTPSAAINEFRQIEVTVDEPGAIVRTVTAYYAQP